MRTSGQFLVNKLRQGKSATPSNSTMHFNKLCSSKHDSHNRCGLHEVRTELRSDHLVSQVPKHSSTLIAEESGSTKIMEYVCASTTPAVLAKLNCTPSAFDVDLETPVRLCKSSRVGNQNRKRTSPSEMPTEA